MINFGCSMFGDGYSTTKFSLTIITMTNRYALYSADDIDFRNFAHVFNKSLVTAIVLFVFGLSEMFSQQSYPITFMHEGKTVFGTFTTPDGSGKFPTIIINPGSGANDRDGTLPLSGGNAECLYPDLAGETLKPYKELAEGLVDSGFAVLRYDKLEFTYPTTLGTITFRKLWLPVEIAIDFIKTRSDVDTNNIVLLGHSEGSSLIPFIAKDRTDIKALISVAGARTPFDTIFTDQIVYFARICDGDTIAAKSQADQILDYYEFVRNGQCNLLPSLFGVPPCVWEDYFDATDPVAQNYNESDLPTLFIGLGLDINVPPAELIRFEEEVNITDDFWSIPDLIHFMTPADDPHISPTLIDTIVYWLRENDVVSGIKDKPLYNDDVNVYPNPFSESININVPEQYGKAFLYMYNAFGQLIQQKALIDSNYELIGLSNLPSGVYIIQIEMNHESYTSKLIKR
jgi:dienelactone hydrolase